MVTTRHLRRYAARHLYQALAVSHTMPLKVGCCLFKMSQTLCPRLFSSFYSPSQFSSDQTASILKRDKEDDAALAVGIKLAIEKKVLPPEIDVEEV